MQPCVLLYTVGLYEFDESGERGFGVHHLEDGVVVAVSAIIEQECCYYVERGIVIFLSSNQTCYLLQTMYSHTPSRQYISCRRT